MATAARVVGSPWPKGVSGNPGGRPRIEPITFVRMMASILRDETMPPEERIAEVRKIAGNVARLGGNRRRNAVRRGRARAGKAPAAAAPDDAIRTPSAPNEEPPVLPPAIDTPITTSGETP